jgi:hypothetical protein
MSAKDASAWIVDLTEVDQEVAAATGSGRLLAA